MLKGATNMDNTHSFGIGHVFAGLIGAVLGGLAVALVTKAIPRMMSGMMRSAMAQRRESGCNMVDV